MTTNVIPNVPENVLNRDFEIYTSPIQNPLQGVWWAAQSISDVPENIMGWLVAQGFEVTGIRQDNTTVPPTNYFAVRKEGLLRQPLLRDLCNNFTYAANEARLINQYRYNEIVKDWAEMISKSHDHFDAQIDEQNFQSGVYLTDLDQYMTAIETMIADNRSKIVIDAENANLRLGEMLEKLDDLETNATNTATDVANLLSQQAGNLNTYLTTYDARLAELDQNFLAYLASILEKTTNLGSVLNTHAESYFAEIDTFVANYETHALEINAYLTQLKTQLVSYENNLNAIFDLLDDDLAYLESELNLLTQAMSSSASQFSGNYESILSQLMSDYLSHSTETNNLLQNLGATETARIQEQFAASLSAQMQQLVSRGLYISTIVADVTQRNSRDKDEQIQLLNDRLNREKVENYHRLHDQKFATRLKMLDGEEKLNAVTQEVLRYQATMVSQIYAARSETRTRMLNIRQVVFTAKDATTKTGIEVNSGLYAKLQDVRLKSIESLDRVYQLRDVFAKWDTENVVRRYEQIQQIEAQFLESVQKQLIAKQDVNKTSLAEEHTLLSELQSAITALNNGRERYAVTLMQNANTLAEHKHKAIVQMMETAVKRLDGWKSVAAENTRLMAYQLDERNKLLIGLYSFVERREDVAPEWKDMAQMIAGLGDAGGGWLTPN